MPLSSRIPAMVSSALFVCVIQYAPATWANVGDTVVISDQTDCSDGHQSAACGWDGRPDLSPSNGGGDSGGGGSDGGRGGGGSEAPAKRTAEQKAADAAKCKEQKTESEGQASRMYDSSMQVCASANSSAIGNYLQLWLQFVPELLGYPARDCASVNTRAYSDALDIFSKRYDMCYTNAQRD